MQIEIVPAHDNWSDDFERLKLAIMRVAPSGAALHHIGSTAVAGLAAKDIIDIQLGVADLSVFDAAAFEQVGFVRGSPTVDHCPPGVDLPEIELRKLFFRSTGRAAHLHVREVGRFNQRFPLLCRDFLRAHPTAAGAYALIKQRLAARAPTDEDFYYDIKDPVFDIIVAGAEEWAKAIDWSVPPGD